jgi:hypothetical protein
VFTSGRDKASANDLLNSQNNRMKSIALERRFSGYSFFTEEKRVTGLKGFESKMAWIPVSIAHALSALA